MVGKGSPTRILLGYEGEFKDINGGVKGWRRWFDQIEEMEWGLYWSNLVQNHFLRSFLDFFCVDCDKVWCNFIVLSNNWAISVFTSIQHMSSSFHGIPQMIYCIVFSHVFPQSNPLSILCKHLLLSFSFLSKYAVYIGLYRLTRSASFFSVNVPACPSTLFRNNFFTVLKSKPLV